MSLESFYLHGMRLALAEAQKAYDAGEVPTGCVILPAPAELLAELAPSGGTPPPAAGGSVPAVSRSPRLAAAHNQTEALCDATAHAEMIAITQAAATLGDWRLTNSVLFVTKEPCAMCAGAIVLSRIPVVVYGLPDPKRGGQSVFGILDHPNLIHRARLVPGILEDECREQLTSFFRERRAEARAARSDPPDHSL